MMPDAHRTAAVQHVTLINRRVSFNQRDELVYAAAPHGRAEVRVQRQPIRRALESLEAPGGVRRFAMRRMALAAPRSAVAAERRAEEISAQGPEQRRSVGRQLLLGPRRDRERRNQPVRESERNRTEMSAEPREIRVDMTRTEGPRRLAVNDV